MTHDSPQAMLQDGFSPESRILLLNEQQWIETSMHHELMIDFGRLSGTFVGGGANL